MEKTMIDGMELILSNPDTMEVDWVGGDDLVRQLTAAWLRIGENDLPMNPRLIGRPGVGKTTLAWATAKKELNRDVYIFQCTMDTRPEDLIVTPVIAADGKIKYHASSLVTAMIKGQVCILDEGNRMSEKSWASLAPLLDQRRYVESVVAGLKIPAHPDFLICVTMNDDASAYEIPEYIHTRLQPSIEISFPDREEEFEILRNNCPYADDDLVNVVADFLQRAHEFDEPYTVRDGISILRFACKLGKKSGDNPGAWLEFSAESVLGEEAKKILDPNYTPPVEDDKRMAFLDSLGPMIEQEFGEGEFYSEEDDDDEDEERSV